MALLLATLMLSPCPVWAQQGTATTYYTTIPSYPVTVAGQNSVGGAATWEDSGHVRARVDSINYNGTAIKQIHWISHDKTVCDAKIASAHTVIHRLHATSGVDAGTGWTITAWVATDWVKTGSTGSTSIIGGPTPFQWTMGEGDLVEEIQPYCPDMLTMQAHEIVHYEVLSWQGDENAPVFRAATQAF